MQNESKLNDGGPAFPIDHWPCHFPGMSLRDWFAGRALAGLLADHPPGATATLAATLAYELADAMIAARHVSRS